jgi:hypothetical protein
VKADDQFVTMSTQQNNPKDRRILGEHGPYPHSNSNSISDAGKPTLSKEVTKRRGSTGTEPSKIPIQKVKSRKPKVAVDHRPVPPSIKLVATLEEALDLATPYVKHIDHRPVKLEPVQNAHIDQKPDIKPQIKDAKVGKVLDRTPNGRVKAESVMEDKVVNDEGSRGQEGCGKEKSKAEEESVPKRIEPKKGVSFAAREYQCFRFLPSDES